MTVQTLSIREAATQLPALVKQTQVTQQSVFLTSEERSAPVAVLTPLVAQPRNGRQAVAHRLELVQSIVQLWQQTPDDSQAGQDYRQLLQSQLRLLAQADMGQSSVFQALVMLLRLAVRQLAIPGSAKQLQAFHEGIAALLATNLDDALLNQVDQALLASGIDAHADLSDHELLTSYVAAS